jgi:hypothetical protein
MRRSPAFSQRAVVASIIWFGQPGIPIPALGFVHGGVDGLESDFPARHPISLAGSQLIRGWQAKSLTKPDPLPASQAHLPLNRVAKHHFRDRHLLSQPRVGQCEIPDRFLMAYPFGGSVKARNVVANRLVVSQGGTFLVIQLVLATIGIPAFFLICGFRNEYRDFAGPVHGLCSRPIETR